MAVSQLIPSTLLTKEPTMTFEQDPFSANQPQISLLEGGIYQGILSDIEVKDYPDFEDKDKFNRGARFNFRLPNEATEASKTIFKFSRHEKSNCYKFTKALLGPDWSKFEDAPNDVLWAAILERKGRWFNLVIETPAPGAKYNRIESVSPVKDKKPHAVVDPQTGDFNF